MSDSDNYVPPRRTEVPPRLEARIAPQFLPSSEDEPLLLQEELNVKVDHVYGSFHDGIYYEIPPIFRLAIKSAEEAVSAEESTASGIGGAGAQEEELIQRKEEDGEEPFQEQQYTDEECKAGKVIQENWRWWKAVADLKMNCSKKTSRLIINFYEDSTFLLFRLQFSSPGEW